MDRDLRNEGWGPEDCYPDGAYEAEQRRNKIAWWKRMAANIEWPDGGVKNECKSQRSSHQIPGNKNQAHPLDKEHYSLRFQGSLD